MPAKPILVQWDGGALYFGDITRSETHRSVLKVTEHAVEDGPDVTDSARREVDRFSCEVLVSNTPLQILNYQPILQSYTIDPNYYTAPLISNLVGAGLSALVGVITGGQTGRFGGTSVTTAVPFDAISDLRNTAIWLQDNKMLLTVITPKAIYNNMLLEVSELIREGKDGDSAPFKLEFKRVRIVQVGFSGTVAVPVDARAKPSKPKGKAGAAVQQVPNSALLEGVQRGAKFFKNLAGIGA